MLRRHSEVFRTALLLGDTLLVAASWFGAYLLRFHSGLPAPLGVPPLDPYLVALGLIVPVWAWVFRSRGLYASRTDSTLSELGSVVAGATTVVVLLVVATFFARSYFFSRGVIASFWALSIASVSSFRVVAREFLRVLHRHGHNLSSVLVVGAGPLAEQVIDRVHEHPEAGLRVVGVLSNDGRVPRVGGVPVLGRYEQVRKVLALCGASQVVLALPREDQDRLEALLDELDDELVDLRLVPDLLHVATLRSSVEDFDGLPVISLRDSPLVGWAAIQKRVFDIAASALLLAVASPFLARSRSRSASPAAPPSSTCRIAWASTDGSFAWSSSAPWCRTPRAVAPFGPAPAIRGRRGSAASCGAPASTSCRSSGTCCVVT